MKSLLFFPILKNCIQLFLKVWSAASFAASVRQEKYYIFLICSLEKHVHFNEKVRKSQKRMLGRMFMNPGCELASSP